MRVSPTSTPPDLRAGFWRSELDRVNRAAVVRLAVALAREFALLRAEAVTLSSERSVLVRRHAGRLTALLGAHGLAAANEAALLAARMLGPGVGAKADLPLPQPTPPTDRSARLSAVLEALARRVVTGALVAEVAAALARNQAFVATVDARIAASGAADPSAIAAALIEDRHIAALVAEVAGAALSGGAGGAGGDGRGASPGGGGGGRRGRRRFSRLVEGLVREQAPQRARRIAATSGDIIAEVLARAAAGGWSERKTARALRAALGDEVAAFRARTIARTEIGAAQNAATMAIAQDRADDGEAIEKVWVSIEDERRRPSHMLAHGQVAAIDQPFALVDPQGRLSLLMHPGDPGAPLREIVNCRCGMLIRRAQSDPGAAPRKLDFQRTP